MKAMHELKEMLCRELDEIAKQGELNAGGLETVHKLTDTIKNIDKIMILEEEDGYSQHGYSRSADWEARGRFGGGNSYDDGGNSYASRRRHYVRGHYSRDDGRDQMMGELEGMMQESSGRDREIIRRAMDELRGV